MKQGSEYAKRIKRLLTQLARKFGKPDTVEGVDPTEQLIIGILAGCTTHAKALAVYRKLRHHVVDLNELRVTPAMELAEQIGDGVPLAREKAQRIVDALNAVRKRQDSLDLTFLKQRGRREAREYLESLEGVDRGVAASVVLFSLGGHAFPLDGLMLHVLQKEDMIDASADPAEVQAFLERCVSGPQAQVFYELLSRYAASKTVKVSYESLSSLIRPTAAERKPSLPVGAQAPAPPTAAKPGTPAHKSSAAAPSKTSAPAKPPVVTKAVEKPNPKKPRPTARPVEESAGKSGGNHNHASSRPVMARKKK